MIYSGVDDNWLRVELLHSLAIKYYSETQGKNCLEITDNKFYFDVRLHDVIRKESCIVEMIATWSVVTLEALANQALAEIISSPEEAKKAIEHPRKYKPFQGKSELSVKIAILGHDSSKIKEIVQVADTLSELRNRVLHDKPFELINFGDGETFIEHYRLRGEPLHKQLRYPDLYKLFESCDQVRLFILDLFDSKHLNIHDCSFLALLDTNYVAPK